jgi:hypothetical protein
MGISIATLRKRKWAEAHATSFNDSLKRAIDPEEPPHAGLNFGWVKPSISTKMEMSRYFKILKRPTYLKHFFRHFLLVEREFYERLNPLSDEKLRRALFIKNNSSQNTANQFDDCSIGEAIDYFF